MDTLGSSPSAQQRAGAVTTDRAGAAPSASSTPSAASATADVTRQRTQRTNYSVRKKRELIALAQVAGIKAVCRDEGVPRRTLRHWMDHAEKINGFMGPDTRKSIGRSGRREILPFSKEMTAFLVQAQTEGRELTSAHMVEYIRENHSEWLTSYMADKKSSESGHAALTRLCQRFVERHGFTTPCVQPGIQPAPQSMQKGVIQTEATDVDAHSGTNSRASNGTYSDASTDASSKCSRSVNDNAKYNANTDTNGSANPDISETTGVSPLDVDDDASLAFGLDIGTTAIKCVVVNATNGQTVDVANVSLGDVVVPGGSTIEAKQGVQNVEQVLLAVQRATMLLHATARRRVTSVGICGQMHGILWWCSRTVHAAAEKLLAASEENADEDEDMLEPAWSELVTWQDQRCTPSFLAQCQEKIARLNTADNASPPHLASGYGLATFAHTLEDSPRTLVGMDACGTIQDFVAFVLCGHTLSSEASMDTTDAHSWGGFNLQTETWDARVLRALQIPSSMLPTIKKPGTSIGCTTKGPAGFGLPEEKPVFVPMGDHPCSVLAALAQRSVQPGSDASLTLVNIGTSAQMAMVLTGESVAKLSSSSGEAADNKSSGFEVRPFLFEDRYLGVAASLSGGNTFAWLVHQWQQWAQEMGIVSADNGDEEKAAQREAGVYERLIALGLQHEDTALEFVPTLNGERADPSATGSILNLRMSNWSMGDISAALSRGLVDNLFAMIPPELRSLVPVQPMIGTGNALVRNALLQRYLLKRLADPSLLQLQTAADAAVGAALTPSLLL